MDFCINLKSIQVNANVRKLPEKMGKTISCWEFLFAHCTRSLENTNFSNFRRCVSFMQRSNFNIFHVNTAWARMLSSIFVEKRCVKRFCFEQICDHKLQLCNQFFFHCRNCRAVNFTYLCSQHTYLAWHTYQKICSQLEESRTRTRAYVIGDHKWKWNTVNLYYLTNSVLLFVASLRSHLQADHSISFSCIFYNRVLYTHIHIKN